jgi:chromosome segregation ATPase
MAQASVEYLTTEAYIEHRWAQDDLIRKEFEKLHNQLETQHRELRKDLDNVKKDVRELKVDFGELREDLDNVKKDVRELKVDFGELKVDFRELKVDFQRMQGQMYNRSIRNLFVRIEPIGIYQHGTGLVIPERFPKNAHEFWNLRAPRSASNCNYSPVHLLAGRGFYR